MTTRQAILFGLQRSGYLVNMYCKDLSRQDLHHRIVPEANNAAWILGHLVLSDRHVMAVMNVPAGEMPPLPFEDFEQRFGRDESASRAGDYGEAEKVLEAFKEHRKKLIAVVEAAPESQFDESLKRESPIGKTIGELLLFWGLHTSMHTGQISFIRRSLGRPPLV